MVLLFISTSSSFQYIKFILWVIIVYSYTFIPIKTSLFLSCSSPQSCCHLYDHTFLLLLKFLIACLLLLQSCLYARCSRLYRSIQYDKKKPWCCYCIYAQNSYIEYLKSIAIVEVLRSSYEQLTNLFLLFTIWSIIIICLMEFLRLLFVDERVCLFVFYLFIIFVK